MKSLLCRLGIHKIDYINIEYDIGVEIIRGSKAAVISHCSCGHVNVLAYPVPINLIKHEYELPTKKGESNG